MLHSSGVLFRRYNSQILEIVEYAPVVELVCFKGDLQRALSLIMFTRTGDVHNTLLHFFHWCEISSLFEVVRLFFTFRGSTYSGLSTSILVKNSARLNTCENGAVFAIRQNYHFFISSGLSGGFLS